MKALIGGNLIDGTGSPPISDTAVVIGDDGRIDSVGRRDAIAIPPGAESIRIDGMSLLPGLIDCHDHLGKL